MNTRPKRAKERMKEAIALFFHYVGISSLFFLLNRKRKRILTYHNVLPRKYMTDTLLDGVSHSDTIFAKQIDYALRKCRSTVDLEDFRAITITFDDGYVNQFEVAHPILALRGVRAYFFVTGSILKSRGPLVIDRLQCWLSFVSPGAYELRLKGLGVVPMLIIGDEEDRRVCWTRLDALMESGAATQDEIMDALEACVPLATIEEGLDATYRRLRLSPLTQDNLAQMKEFGHLVGPHGQSHESLALLDDVCLDAEIRKSASPVAEVFNTDVYSYPFGGEREVTLRVLDAMRAAGYERAVANTNRPLGGGRNYEALFIPRMSLPNDARVHLMSFVLSGAEYFLRYCRLLPRWTEG